MHHQITLSQGNHDEHDLNKASLELSQNYKVLNIKYITGMQIFPQYNSIFSVLCTYQVPDLAVQYTV